MRITVKDIANSLEHAIVHGDPNVVIAGITHDSRMVAPGWLFAALPGQTVDGHDFIPAAIDAGAVAILAEIPPLPEISFRAWIETRDSRAALPRASAEVYGHPSKGMTVIGITGTNGKTSLTYILESILKEAGFKPGVIGTVNYRWGRTETSAARTTPEAPVLQRILADMLNDGVTHVIMEVSSHGLLLKRLEDCHFDVAVFTNLSQDHLDFHPSLEDYYQAKRILFSKLLVESEKQAKFKVLNMDDPYGGRLRDDPGPTRFIGYGTSKDSQVRALDVGFAVDGISGRALTPRGELSFESRLVGGFNLLNILAAIGVSEALNLDHRFISQGLASIQSIPGRLEKVESPIGTALVDYAHTPDAIKTALKALHAFRNGWSGRIITVMGCGGDRDKTKRPVMGREAANWSDVLIITSDNPRTEKPAQIIEDILQGVQNQGVEIINDPEKYSNPGIKETFKGIVIIEDRRKAINWAVHIMDDHDVLLVAGKGHETYQEINGVRFPFDDREVVREALLKRFGPEKINGNKDTYKQVPEGGAAHEG